MSAITIRALLRRRRRRRQHLALICVVVALAAVIVVHHSAMSTSSMDHGMGMSAVAEMCLGVFAAVGAAVVAVAIGVLALSRLRALLVCVPSAPPAVRPPMVRVRDGPALLVLLCVRRH